MHTFLLISGLFITMFFFLLDKNLLPGTLIARKHIIDQLRKNKQKELQLESEFENLIASYKAWSYNAFPESDITYSEYIALLKEKSSIEYSDAEFEKIKSGLKRDEVSDFMEKIKNQEEAVIALQANLDWLKKNMQSVTIANAS